MDIRQLRYFLSAVNEGTLAAAAQANYVTQPAISLQIKRLEAEVGEKLFRRQGRRLAPTEAGRVLARRAADVVRRMDSLEATMRGFGRLEQGQLRVGTIDAASVYVLPDLYQEFHARYPGITVEITVGDTRTLLEALRRGSVELATTTLPVDASGFVVREIYREDLVPVTHPGHPLASKGRVGAKDLAQAGLITYPAGATTRGLIDDVFEAHGVHLAARMEISSPEAIKRLCQAGLGAAILPRPVVAVELEGGSLAELRVAGARFERALGMVHPDQESLSPAARVFLDMVVSRTAGGA